MRVVSLFSGCGGLDLGLEQAGFDITLASDIDKRCAESHRLNFPTTKFFEGNVTDLISSGRLKELAAQAPIDLLAGGPPCPPFSKSRFYRKDKPRALDDPTGSETIEGYLTALEQIKPRAFLMENVPGFAYKVHQEAFEHVSDRARRAGYRLTWRILNAADYGVPQMRQRFLMVGTREDEPIFAWPSPTHGEPAVDKVQQRLLDGEEVRPWCTAGEAIGDLDTEANADDDGHFAGGQYHDLLKQVPPGDNYLYFTKERGHPQPVFKWRSRYWSFLLKLSPDAPSWTIQARRSNNMGPFHWRSRILRVGEVKRLQTFPDEWQLCGTVEQQWRQVGNAVPPLLARHLGAALHATLNGADGVGEDAIALAG